MPFVIPIGSSLWRSVSVWSAFFVLVLAAGVTTASASATRGREDVSARIVLPSRTLATGTTMEATVVVQNRTGKEVTGIGCGSLFQVALRNKRTEPMVLWKTCRERLTVPKGRSRYRVTFAATDVLCFGDGGRPLCVDGRPGAVPPGKYRATLYQNPIVVPHPQSVAVRVTL
jgi:hypothetical protein